MVAHRPPTLWALLSDTEKKAVDTHMWDQDGPAILCCCGPHHTNFCCSHHITAFPHLCSVVVAVTQ